MPADAAPEEGEPELAVGVVCHDRLAVVAASGDVVERSDLLVARRSAHVADDTLGSSVQRIARAVRNEVATLSSRCPTPPRSAKASDVLVVDALAIAERGTL
jgi:hypothetical protein